jgi:uncharacterized protein (DUF849 family)
MGGRRSAVLIVDQQGRRGAGTLGRMINPARGPARIADGPSMLTACLNGSRRPDEHPFVPLTPAQLAAAGAEAVAAGAEALHVHPRDDRGRETLDPGHVGAAVAAIRAAAPGMPVGVTTGAWIATDPAARLRLVRSWDVLPDVASVNWHESGAEQAADALLSRGIGVEAGLWNVDAARSFMRAPIARSCCRLLIEPMEVSVRAALDNADQMIDLVAPIGPPIQLHGCENTAWPILLAAARQGLEVRIGVEDVRFLPDGTPAGDNADLVTAAVALINASPSRLPSQAESLRREPDDRQGVRTVSRLRRGSGPKNRAG